MSQCLIVGWAPGDDPNFLGTAAENSAPIWLTGGHRSPRQHHAFDVCIDDGGNGGPNTDPITGRTYDRTITGITPLQPAKGLQRRQWVAGQDETGMQLWVCDATNGTDAIDHRRLGRGP